MKKLLSLLISLSILAFSCPAASASPSTPTQPQQLALFSQNCPEPAKEFAEDNFLPFLTASVESGAFQVGNIIQLGSPFTILSQNLATDVYYFPIISDGVIVATFRIYQDRKTRDYVGIMSKYLADELSALDTSNSSPALLYMDENNLMVQIEDETRILSPSSDGSAPSGVSAQSLSGVQTSQSIVAPLEPITTVSRDSLVFSNEMPPANTLIYPLLKAKANEDWCFVCVAVAIIRYVPDQSTSPQASCSCHPWE